MQAEHDLEKARYHRRQQALRKQPRPRQRQLNEEGLRTSYHESRTDSPVQVSCLNVTKCKHKKNAFKKSKVSSFQTTVFKPQRGTDWPR